MRTQIASLALLLGLLPATVRAASLDRDWAKIYDPPGAESVLGMWPAPGGGVDIAVDHAGQLTYIQYNSAGTLTAERATGVGISTMPFRVLESDGAGGFLVAANQDSLGKIYGLVVMRISASGAVMWRRLSESTIYYPKAMEIHAGRIYLGIDGDFFTTYDPMLFVYDLGNGTKLSENLDRGYYFRISDIAVLDDGRAYLAGYDNDECECFTWIRAYDAKGGVLKTNPYPGHSLARFAAVSPSRNVVLTSARALPLSAASFAVTWLHSFWDIPTANIDSRDLMEGGSRAHELVNTAAGLLIGGEHDAGAAAQELLIGTVEEFSGLDVELVRPNPAKSYEALQLVSAGDNIVMLGKETNVGGGSPARIVLLFDENRALQDYDVEGNLPSPVSMAIGEDGGVYTVGAGGPPGIVLTKLIISGAIGVPETASKAPSANRLGLPSPNPATSSVRLEYEVAREGETTLEIYDPAGRLVTRLLEGRRSPGQHVAEWDTRNVAKGVYLARFQAGSSYATRKIVIE